MFKYENIEADAFFEQAKKFIGGEVSFSGTGMRMIFGHVLNVEKREDCVRVICKWLARYYQGKDVWKKCGFKHFDIHVGKNSMFCYTLYKEEASEEITELSAHFGGGPFPGFGYNLYNTEKGKRALEESQVQGL